MSRAHTISLIRHLTAIGGVTPTRRPGRWPPTRHPDAIGLAYKHTIVQQVCAPARDYMVAIFPEIFRLLAEQRHQQGRTDASSPRRPRYDKDPTAVALVVARDVGGRLLLGRRRDNDRWTLPGGHLERDEPPAAGAARELREETGLRPIGLRLLETRANPRALVQQGLPELVHVYEAEVAGEPTGARDPDEECSEWRFFALPLPRDVLANLHGPRDRAHNVVFSIPGAAPHLDARTPRAGAIGTGRAAQLGKKSAEKDMRKARKTAREVDREFEQASTQGKRAAALIDRAAREFAAAFRPDALFSVVSQFGKATDDFSRLQLDQQLRSAIGVPFSAIEKPHRDKLSDWSVANVDQIKTLPDRYFDDIRLRVEDAFTSGMHPSTLADNLADAYDISENNAERIARDQTLTLAANLNEERMTSLGVEEYVWRTVNDGRVRENHAELNGQRFRFDDPPMGGGTSEDEPGNPGDGILCRCYADPVLDALIEG